MSDISRIINGWMNYTFKKPLVEEEAKRRAGICASCDMKKDNIILRCEVCNCPLAMLTRSEESVCKHPDGAKW
jgi:hypothetical protein